MLGPRPFVKTLAANLTKGATLSTTGKIEPQFVPKQPRAFLILSDFESALSTLDRCRIPFVAERLFNVKVTHHMLKSLS